MSCVRAVRRDSGHRIKSTQMTAAQATLSVIRSARQPSSLSSFGEMSQHIELPESTQPRAYTAADSCRRPRGNRRTAPKARRRRWFRATVPMSSRTSLHRSRIHPDRLWTRLRGGRPYAAPSINTELEAEKPRESRASLVSCRPVSRGGGRRRAALHQLDEARGRPSRVRAVGNARPRRGLDHASLGQALPVTERGYPA